MYTLFMPYDNLISTFIYHNVHCLTLLYTNLTLLYIDVPSLYIRYTLFYMVLHYANILHDCTLFYIISVCIYFSYRFIFYYTCLDLFTQINLANNCSIITHIKLDSALNE